MNDIKGFFEIPSLVNNGANTIAKYGEMSQKSLTASRDPRIFAGGSTAPNVNLRTFRVVDSAGISIQLPSPVSTKILTLGQWLFNQYDSGSIPTDLQRELLASSISTEFGFSNVTLGAINQGPTANKRLPAWVRFTWSDAGQDYTVKIWLADANFLAEYEHYQVFAIPPTASLSSLRLDLVGLTNVLTTQDSQALIADAISAARTVGNMDYPETAIVRKTLQWHDLSDPEVYRDTTWMYVVYGPAGQDDDAIKEATRAYIAANSTEGQWNVIYPSLYSENEFVIIPLWNEVAVPAAGVNSAIFSPMATPKGSRDIVSARLPVGYAQSSSNAATYVDVYLRLVPSAYRELMLGIIGNPNNSNSVIDFKTRYPDYTRISTDVADFQRMEQRTQDFIIALHAALDVAYNATMSSTLPAGYTRLIRSNRLYVCFIQEGYQYMVLARSSYNGS